MYTLIYKIMAHEEYCIRCLLSPDMRYLATCSSDKTIKIFDVNDGFRLLNKIHAHEGWIWDLGFSADSAYIVSASSDQTAALWDLKKGQRIVRYIGHTKAVTCVALNDSSL